MRHAVGAAGDVTVSLASVRLDAGPVVVTGVDAPARPSDRVEVTDADRVWARRVRRGSTD